jgi:two-component system, NarL family, sensor histidine kinase UhpB
MAATITGTGHALTLETVTTGRTEGATERAANGHGNWGVRRLLRVPLFYKILVANALILAAVVFAAGVTAHASANGDVTALVLLLGGGLLLSVVSNAAILRLALQPLRRLQRTAEQVHAGDLAARVEPSELADRDLEQLMLTFNTILDSGDVYRRRLREIAARALNATEEERKRIARELHDGTAQTLAALRLRLRLARSAADEATRAELLERISADLGEATEEIRRIAQGLRPPALDMLGLAPAIESCARGIGENTGLNVETALSPVEDMLVPEAELALYRIVQEALSNVARHSDAGQVRIRLGRAGGEVVAVVEDDGRGFAVRDEMSSGGLGLFGMQERAAYVGGTVEIESQPGRGTRIQATIPVVETAPYA